MSASAMEVFAAPFEVCPICSNFVVDGDAKADQSALTNLFGYYSFANAQAGEISILNIFAKPYQVENLTRILNLTDETQDGNFAAH